MKGGGKMDKKNNWLILIIILIVIIGAIVIYSAATKNTGEVVKSPIKLAPGEGMGIGVITNCPTANGCSCTGTYCRSFGSKCYNYASVDDARYDQTSTGGCFDVDGGGCVCYQQW